VLILDNSLLFDPSQEEEFFATVPARAAVCLILPREEQAQPHLIRTADLRRRLQRLLGPADPASKRLNLRDFAREVRYRVTGSSFEQSLTFYQQAKHIFPGRYRDMTRLRAPAVLKVSLRNPYPRCYVTRHIAINEHGEPVGGAYYGPFATRRSAQAFAERMLDFFKVRRCQIKIRRDPAFPGCIYSEMKMCLAPCFAGCTPEEYGAEVQRLVTFLDSSGGSLRDALEREREQASNGLDFERAAALHKKVEKLDDALRGQPELTRRIEQLDAVILQRAADERAIGIYAVKKGRLAEPFFLRFGEMADQQHSVEETVRYYLEGENITEAGVQPDARASAAELGEHLGLVARWFYGNPREGEIFFREKDWPYRRILRACSRLLKKEPAEDRKS
jgi:excinuclease UvrABC nuclease subunit